MDKTNEAAAGCSKEVLNGGRKNEYNLEESDAPMVFEPDDWVDYGVDDDENKQSINSELPSEIETYTLDPPKSKRRKLATFDELLENLDYNILHLNLTKLLQFLESNHKEIRFPFVLKEYTDFFKKIVRNNNLLKSKSLDANYRDICDKIIEAASLKKTGFFFTCTCEYRKGYQNTVLIIKKVYVKQKTDKETMLSSGSADTMPSSQSSEVDSLSRSSSPAFISSGFKVHCLRTALAFIKNDVTKTKEFPELNLEQAQFMQLLFNSVTVLSDFDSSSETKELYRALWEAVRIHSLKYEFRVSSLDTLGGKKSLVFEKILKRKPGETAANINQLANSAQPIINSQPEALKPETPQPGNQQPETPKPETPKPESPQPEIPKPQTPQPETPPPPKSMFKMPRAPKLTKRMRKKHKRLQNVLLFIQNMRHQFVTDTLDSIIDFLSDPEIISRSFAPHTPGEQEFYRKCVHWCRNGYLAMISTEFHALQNRILMLLKQVSCRVVKTSASKVNKATGLTEVTYIKPKLYHGPIPDHTQSSPKKQKVNLQTILKMAASGDTTNVSSFVNLYKSLRNKKKNKKAKKETLKSDNKAADASSGSSSARHKSWSDDSCSESDSNSDSSEGPTSIQTVSKLREKKKNKKETKMKYRKANGRKAKSGRAGTNEAIELAKAECAEKPRLRRGAATRLNELIRKEQLKEALSVPVHSDKAMRMMLGMGWSGGALGPRGDGIKEPLMPALDIARGAGFGHNRNVKTVTLPKKPQERKPVLSWITDTSNTSIPDTNDIVVQKTNQLLLKNPTFDSIMKITELPSSSKSNVQLLKPSPSIVELPTSNEELPKTPVSKFELPTSVFNKELPKPPVSIVELPSPSASNVEFPTPSAPNSELPTPSTSKCELLTPSASKQELPSQSASNVELPTTLASNVELLKPSASNVKLPTTLASNVELLKPSASNVKLPTTLASNVELLKPSASNVKLPTTLASNVELLKPSASNVKLPKTLASNIELLKPSASNVKLPTTLASNIELRKPSASNVKLPTTLASNVELLKPSASNVKLPTTLASNVELPKPSSPNSELLKSSALNSELPKSSSSNVELPSQSASNLELPKSSAPNSVPPKSSAPNFELPTPSAHNVEPPTPSASNVELPKPSAPNVELSKMIKEHKQLEISEFRLLFRKEILYNVYNLLNTNETCKILKYGQVIPKTCQMFVQYAMEALKSTQSNRGLFLPNEQEIYRKIQCKYQEVPDFIVKGFFSKDFMKINLHKVPVTAKEVKHKPIRAAKPIIITEANVQAFIAQYDTRPGTQKTYNSMKFRVLFLMNMLDFAKSSYEEVLINFNKALTVKQKSFVERAVEEINLRIRFGACVAEIKLSVEIRNHIKDAYLCIIIFRENRSVLISKTFPFKKTNTPENEVAGKSQTAFDTDYFSSNTIIVNEENNTINSTIDQIYLDTEDSSDEEYSSIYATAKVPELAHGKKAVNLSDYIQLYEKTKNSNINNDSASNEMTENINNKNNIGNGNIFFDNNDNQVIDMKRDFGKSETLAGRENIAEFVCTTEEISDPTLSDEDSKEETEQLIVKDGDFHELKDEIMEVIVDEEVAIKGESIEVTKTCESKEVFNTNALLEVFNKFESRVTNKDNRGESIAEINKVESAEEINKVESNEITNKGELIKCTNKDEINDGESVKATNSVESSEDMNVAQTEENSKNPSGKQMETESHSEAKTDCVINSNEIIVLSEDDCDTETVVYRTNEPSTSKKPKVYNLSIVHTNHPIKKLTHGKVAEIQKHISKKIMQTKQLPLLMCQGFENGRLIYSCHNKNTYVWLQNTLSVVSQIKEFNSREVTRMAVTFYCYFDFVIDYLFKMIELYNRDLSTKDWIVEKTEKHGDYVTFIIRMDKFSINFIQASGLALFAGVDKVEFRPIWE